MSVPPCHTTLYVLHVDKRQTQEDSACICQAGKSRTHIAPRTWMDHPTHTHAHWHTSPYSNRRYYTQCTIKATVKNGLHCIYRYSPKHGGVRIVAYTYFSARLTCVDWKQNNVWVRQRQRRARNRPAVPNWKGRKEPRANAKTTVDIACVSTSY